MPCTLPSPGGWDSCLGDCLALGAEDGGEPQAQLHTVRGHGAARSCPLGAAGLLGGVSLVLSSWESPGYPSEGLWLCLGCGNSQAVPWAETHQGCVQGTCARERGDAVGSLAGMSPAPGHQLLNRCLQVQKHRGAGLEHHY